jgi:hypothetical protein
MGGAPAAGAIVVGGLIVGIVVGAGTGGGASVAARRPASPLSEIYPCPNMGPPLLTVKSGQHVYVTGKTADGTWLRIHYGSAGRAGGVDPGERLPGLGSLDGIPVASCAPEALLAVVPSPTESMTATGTFRADRSDATASQLRRPRRRRHARRRARPTGRRRARRLDRRPADPEADPARHPRHAVARTGETTPDCPTLRRCPGHRDRSQIERQERDAALARSAGAPGGTAR